MNSILMVNQLQHELNPYLKDAWNSTLLPTLTHAQKNMKMIQYLSNNLKICEARDTDMHIAFDLLTWYEMMSNYDRCNLKNFTKISHINPIKNR